jgi:hypothetical protein
MKQNDNDKLSDYTGVPKDSKQLIIQKSNPLLSLSETGMSLFELKLLDLYLSRIDSHNPEKRKVRFEKGEIEKLFGVNRIKKEILDKKLDGLFSSVSVKDKSKPQGFIKMSLFETAAAYLDENGNWLVDLSCSPMAMEYIFNIENMDFDGIEARYFLNNEQDTEFYIKFAKEKGLYYTAGSDFHTRIEEYRIHGLIGDVFLNAEEIEDFLAQSGLDIWVEEFFL